MLMFTPASFELRLDTLDYIHYFDVHFLHYAYSSILRLNQIVIKKKFSGQYIIIVLKLQHETIRIMV